MSKLVPALTARKVIRTTLFEKTSAIVVLISNTAAVQTTRRTMITRTDGRFIPESCSAKSGRHSSFHALPAASKSYVRLVTTFFFFFFMLCLALTLWPNKSARGRKPGRTLVQGKVFVNAMLLCGREIDDQRSRSSSSFVTRDAVGISYGSRQPVYAFRTRAHSWKTLSWELQPSKECVQSTVAALVRLLKLRSPAVFV